MVGGWLVWAIGLGIGGDWLVVGGGWWLVGWLFVLFVILLGGQRRAEASVGWMFVWVGGGLGMADRGDGKSLVEGARPECPY